jgi:hypothetical protein
MTRYERARGVLWRAAPDRIVTRRVRAGADGALDLFGPAAVVWAALDEPATVDEIDERLADADVELDTVADIIDDMVAAGVVAATTERR